MSGGPEGLRQGTPGLKDQGSHAAACEAAPVDLAQRRRREGEGCGADGGDGGVWAEGRRLPEPRGSLGRNADQ